MIAPHSLKTRGQNRRGQAKTEYVIVVLLIAIGTIGIVSLFGDNIRALFAGSANSLTGNESVMVATAEATGFDPHKNLSTAGFAAVTNTGGGSSGSSGSSGASGSGSGSSGASGGLGSSESALGGQDNAAGNSGGSVSAHGKTDGENASAGVTIDLGKGSHSAASAGSDNAGASAGNIDYGATAGAKYDTETGQASAGVHAEVGVSAVEVHGEATLGNEDGAYVKGSVEGKAGTASASIDASVAVGKDGVSASIELGAEANVAEGEISAEGGFRVPSWVPGVGDTEVTIAGSVSGQFGVAAKGHAQGSLGKEGAGMSMGGKAAAGLGGGFEIDVGIKFN